MKNIFCSSSSLRKYRTPNPLLLRKYNDILQTSPTSLSAHRAAHNQAQAITDFLTQDVLGPAKEVKGRDVTVIDIIEAAAAKLEEGKDHWSKCNLAQVYYSQGRYKEAERLLLPTQYNRRVVRMNS